MKKILCIPIECGEKTCASEPGKFCPQMTISKFGKDYSCHLFEKRLKGPSEAPIAGWLQRLPECLAAEERPAPVVVVVETCHSCKHRKYDHHNEFFCHEGCKAHWDAKCPKWEAE